MSGFAPHPRKVFLVLNPVAGQAYSDNIRRAFALFFPAGEWQVDILETTGAESIEAGVREAVQKGVYLVIAAGGDGTISRAANGLRGTNIPLGILPAGTGNILARGLGLPLGIDAAMRLLAGEHDLMDLDVLAIGGQWYVLNVSVGLTSNALRSVVPEQKRQLGVLAYLFAALQWFGWQPRRFEMVVDGKERRVRASEILVSSGEVLRGLSVPVGPPCTFCDGQLEAYIVRARSAMDYLAVVWNMLFRRGKSQPGLRHLPVRNMIRIDSGARELPVQADGDPIGMTPVEVHIIPKAVRVVVPKARAFAG
ncbi:MAG: diacylglycerol kinase family lipid kinase [Anaerolineales bacterium]|nr:diacylglycerol kinase family lipid kinase [Anaerolineales bacterium]